MLAHRKPRALQVTPVWCQWKWPRSCGLGRAYGPSESFMTQHPPSSVSAALLGPASPLLSEPALPSSWLSRSMRKRNCGQRLALYLYERCVLTFNKCYFNKLAKLFQSSQMDACSLQQQLNI